jgi:hypothetical protein
MQTPFEHAASWRGMLRFAWMQLGKFKPATPGSAMSRDHVLVSWQRGARSRREDELERMRQSE